MSDIDHVLPYTPTDKASLKGSRGADEHFPMGVDIAKADIEHLEQLKTEADEKKFLTTLRDLDEAGRYAPSERSLWRCWTVLVRSLDENEILFYTSVICLGLLQCVLTIIVLFSL
jgi:hypothetical protein